ncbi:ribonuclease Z [Luedemannella helvata]|uniref:Ribonuclease Z n=1 Tax=Luedemannella helvata TaxID=349315 RepID=A0ABP4XHK0_9ACTN
MSQRELVVLGTASQAPTRTRNHNGYLLRWDGEGFLFDPGEGTQRQLTYAGVASSAITRVCLTHFHGDHCLGVPGVLQRLSKDKVEHPVTAHYPASGAEYFARLRYSTAYHETADVREEPVAGDGPVAAGGTWTLEARALDHRIDAFGYRLVEADGRRMVPERLAERGIAGPAVGELQHAGRLTTDGRTTTIDEVSEPRPGQRFAFVMDTRLCDAVYALADGVDLLVIEATYLDADSDLADTYAHLTAAQAARVAAACGVRRLVLTHFSARYTDPALFLDEAARHFDGDIVVAEDLVRVPVPARR